MNKVQARKLVLVSAFLLAAIAVYRDRKTEGAGGTFKALWGVGVVSFVLSLAADFAPGVAGPFAGLVVLGSLTNDGDKLIQNALGKVSSGSTTAGGTTASGTTNAPRPNAPAGKTPVGGTR